MITQKLKTILKLSGCTLVLYESDKIANVLTDRSDQNDIVGLIIQPNDLTLEIKANAILEHYNPVLIEVFSQVRLEDLAENNEQKLEDLLAVVKKIVLYLIKEGIFKKLNTFQITKIQETKYDANVIGWSMPFDLTYLENASKDPCP
jgi:hypothetical protein